MSKYSITVKADTQPELADRLLALGAALTAVKADPVMPEVREAAKSTKGKTKTADAPKATDEAGESAEASTGGTEESSSTSTTSSTAMSGASPSEEKPAPKKEPEVQKADEAKAEGPSIRELTLKLVDMGRRPKVEAILAKFGLDRTTSVDDERKQDMINALTDALAE